MLINYVTIMTLFLLITQGHNGTVLVLHSRS
jgi:hypothetical protein